MIEIGNTKCLEKAKNIEANLSNNSVLNLRDLELDTSGIALIVTIHEEEKNYNSNSIISISFSYNTFLGNEGAAAIVKSLPPSISEIGLVDCGIGDPGGIEILTWMKNTAQLRMICMEQNNFSETLKAKFKDFEKSHPNVLVVF